MRGVSLSGPPYMYFKTLGRATISDYTLGLLVILILRKPFVSVKWWREIDLLVGTGLGKTQPRCWIEFSLQPDDGKKI